MLILDKIPKKATIIDGLPSVGVVSTIVTEYLIESLNAKLIGEIIIEDMPPIVAIHNKEVVRPFGIFYSEEKNIVLLHGLTTPEGHEWQLSEEIMKLSQKTKARHILTIDGVPAREEKEPRTYFYTTDKEHKIELEKSGSKPINNGIVFGVTSFLLIKNQKIPHTCLFAETQLGLPDSRSASSLINELNKILKIDIDATPLIKKSEAFEKKLKEIISNAKNATEFKKQKSMNYVG